MARFGFITTKYDEALATIQDQKREIDRLQQIIDLQNERISELESQIEEHEECEEEPWIRISDEEFEELEERVFLRDIGFDPDELPSSVGARLDIRRVLSGEL